MSLKSWLIPLISIPCCLIFAKTVDAFAGGYVQLLLTYCCINIILAVSLNLINGFTGQFSLGHAGFMAVGAYLSAWLSTRYTPIAGPMAFLNFPIYAICGGTLAAFAGLLVGLPSLRLRGDYLAIVTLGFNEIIKVVLLNMNVVGGARGFIGIPGVPGVDIGNVHLGPFFMSFSMALLWMVIAIGVMSRLVRSRHGRGYISVREDEIAAEAMGVHTTAVKVQAFVISSFFAGVAGSIFAHYANYLSPTSFGFLRSVNIVIMVVLGGMGSITGSVVAAIIVTLLPELLRPLQQITGVDLRMVIFSLTLILVMILRPQGLFGSREINVFWKRKRDASNATA